jgi:hypothetical protein
VHDFDIYNQDFILLYTGTNQTLVFEIEMQIYFAYRMTLPLFPEYEDYTYFASNGIVVRSIYDGYLVQLMEWESSYKLFFY